MSKNLRLPLIGGAAVAAVGLFALMLFQDDSEPNVAESNTNTSQTATESVSGVKKDPVPAIEPVISILPPISIEGAASDVVTDEGGDESSIDNEGSAKGPVIAGTQTSEGAKGSVVLYEIQPGDAISKVAVKFGCSSKEIYELNAPKVTAENAHKVRVGWKIKVPNTKGLSGFEVVGGAPAASTTTAPKTEELSNPVKPTEAKKPLAWNTAHEHKLQRGESVFTLSEKYYGSKLYWSLIEKANADQWDTVSYKEGLILRIPALENPTPTSVVEAPARSGGNIIPGRN